MHCSSCGFDNPGKMRFCGQCGAPLETACSHCNFYNPAHFKFCGQCGAPLLPYPPLSIPLISPSLPTSNAERRHLTVMFCDLVGSTALSEQLDPEELREVLQAYQQVAAEVIDRFDGHIAQYLGDGLLIYFGYPLAHENDPQRAVLSGLGIIAELGHLNTNLEQGILRQRITPLQIRVGIHTGLVVVGDIGGERREQLALGETTNIAARLQQMAKANTVVISAATYHLVAGFFTCRLLGRYMLKGFSRSMETYQVLHASRAYSRFEAALTVAGLTPLVDREEEIAVLLDRWEHVKAGQGQVILITGEAGIGKSRLAQVFKERVTGEPQIWLHCHASPYHQDSRLYPIIELLQRLLRFRSKDTPEQKLNKLELALKLYDMSLPEIVPLFTSLLSLPLPPTYTPLDLTPQRQKQLATQAFLTILSKLSALRPVIILIEDLHWIDPSTLEMLDALVDQLAELHVFCLFTFRPEFSPPWTRPVYLTQLNLTRLPRSQVETLIRHITGGKAIPVELRQQIIAKTDGVPIFVEELTKMVLELDQLQEGDDNYQLISSLPQLAIPATLQDSLMARLDRLGPAREVAQLCAILGRVFTYRLLKAIALAGDAGLQDNLAQLVEAELLYQQGLPPQAAYTFKHALIQDAAYRSLLRRKRQFYHRQIAQVLTEQFPETARSEPELLAYHYTSAGLFQQAITYWQLAGQRALLYSANLEAANHFKKALELLTALPETSERLEQELQLQIALGAPLLMTKGYGASDVEAAYDRARELCQQLADKPQLSSALFGLWVFYLARGRHQTAFELAQQLMQLSEQTPDPTLQLQAHQALGISYLNLGQLSLARAHLEQGLALYKPGQHGIRQTSTYVGADRGVACLSHLALTLWLLGYPDQALNRCQEAVRLADELGHAYSRVFALFFAAWLHQYRWEADFTHTYAAAAISLAFEHDFKLLEPLASIMEGWVLTEQGQLELGLEQMFQSLAQYRTTGAEIGHLHILTLLAQAHAKLEQIEAGLAVLNRALQLIQEKSERFCEAELYRLKGELLLKQSRGANLEADWVLTTEAEATFRQAIQLARHQQTKSLELRATISLSRLYYQQGQIEQAHQILAPLYAWFTEGFDTMDLKEAKALLDSIPYTV